MVARRSFCSQSEESTVDDEVPRRLKGGVKEVRGSVERSCKGKAKGKGYSRGIRCYGNASTHPWSQCRLVKYESWKEHRGRCGERGHPQDFFEVTRASREWYVVEYDRPWEWTVNLVPSGEGEEPVSGTQQVSEMTKALEIAVTVPLIGAVEKPKEGLAGTEKEPRWGPWERP